MNRFVSFARLIGGTAFVLFTALLLTAAGCTRPEKTTARQDNDFNHRSCTPSALEPSDQTNHPAARPEQIEIGRSVAGKPIQAEIYGNGATTVLIIATIHGNEAVGTPLVLRLGSYLEANPGLVEGRRVILVPVVNPDGMAANQRTNLRGVDLNRNFPASNYTSGSKHGAAWLSEPESRALYGLIEKYSPDRIISIHQPIGCIDYDGPGDRLARAMATSSGMPLKRLGGLPGSLGSYVGISKQTPIITIEFARSADNLSAEELWRRYGRMMLVSVCFPDAVPTIAGSSTGSLAPPVAPSYRALGK
jgi:protein MpaA